MSVSPSAQCAALYEDVDQERADNTHSCDLAAGHAGRHRCPVCGVKWSMTATEEARR